jgi:hypothetical protein
VENSKTHLVDQIIQCIQRATTIITARPIVSNITHFMIIDSLPYIIHICATIITAGAFLLTRCCWDVAAVRRGRRRASTPGSSSCSPLAVILCVRRKSRHSALHV